MEKGLNCKSITANLLLLLLLSAASRAASGDDNLEVVAICAVCSEQTYSPICSSNGITFNNMCEFEKSKCEKKANWRVIYTEPCVTLPPPPIAICTQHQFRFNNYGQEEYDQMCNSNTMTNKANNGTLELGDVTECYTPYCIKSGTEYLNHQCSYIVSGWCWCSDAKGIAIEGTLEKSWNSERCSNRSVCNYNGKEYEDTQLFLPPNGCGLCECLDSMVRCWTDYVPNNEGKLNDSQVQLFTHEMIQLFNLQHGRHEQTIIDIRHIRQHPFKISESRKIKILRWKFDYYNRDTNDVLSPSEQFLFRIDMDSFLFCVSFFDHIIELMDADENTLVTQLEWTQFFTNSEPKTQINKRSAPSEFLQRKLNNRKKFYYILS